MDAMNHDRWLALSERLGCPSLADHFQDLERAYADKRRAYHTARHIEECLSLFDSLRALCRSPDEVEFALWLHDVVYEPRHTDNEEKSADLALQWLTRCGFDPEAAERVRGLIMATRHAGEPRSRDEELLTDIDLHVLGASPERFDEYEAQVRREYRWVPGPIFRRRRSEILRGFLARDPLYRTEECRARFEEPARANLRRSLERLAG